MAFIGLKYMVAAPISAETPASGSTAASVTYGAGFVVGKAVNANINITTANAKLYGDDAVAEADNGFVEGTVDIGTTEMTDDIQSKMLGHTDNDGEITASSGDVAPYLGLGFYAPKLSNHARKYRAIWFTKSMAGEPNENLQTKQGATQFQTPSIPMTIMEDITGAWKKEQTFDTEAAAITWLNTKANIS